MMMVVMRIIRMFQEKVALNSVITLTLKSERVSCSVLSNSLDPMECSLPGSSVHGILWARILEWVAISFYRGSSDPGIKPGSPALQADSLPTELQEEPRR